MRLRATRVSAIRHSSQRTLEQQIAAIYRDCNGVWYDPSDFKTMFQDSAGATPVTGVEQPVGLILDKSGRAHHASQTVSTKRPVLSARYNQLLDTETLATQNVTVRATLQTLSIYGTGTVTLSGASTAGPLVGTGTGNRVSLTFTPTAGTLTLTVSGSVTKAQLGESAILKSYQRINTATDYDAAGFPLRLAFDGVDDALSTSPIDFTATDKMTVVAGVRKLGDVGMVLESSADAGINAGSMWLYTASGLYGVSFRGTSQSPLSATPFVKPITNVVSGIGRISTPVNTIRVNGSQIVTSSATQGTGNFGNYPLYVGSRAGTSLPFNGHINSLLIFGKTLTSAQLAVVERYVGRKTGVTL